MIHGHAIWRQLSSFSTTWCEPVVALLLLAREPVFWNAEAFVETHFSDQRERVSLEVRLRLSQKSREGLGFWQGKQEGVVVGFWAQDGLIVVHFLVSGESSCVIVGGVVEQLMGEPRMPSEAGHYFLMVPGFYVVVSWLVLLKTCDMG